MTTIEQLYNKLSSKKIMVTNDYSIFKTLPGNRSVVYSRAQKIRHSIENAGYVTNPIIVNEKMEVIDGQGRLAALKSLQLPVEYIVHRGATVNECIALNAYNTKWSTNDFIKSYAAQGNPSYLAVKTLMEKYPKFSLRVLGVALKGHTGSEYLKANARQGTIKISNAEFEKADKEILPKIYKFANLPAKDIHGPSYILHISLIFAMSIEGVNVDRLLNKTYISTKIMTPFSNRMECLQSLEEIYNTGLKKTDRVYFTTEFKKIA